MRQLLAALIVVAAAEACSPEALVSTSASIDDGRVVYLSLTAKGAVPRFLNRMASADAQVVVTQTPVADAIESKMVRLDPSEHAMLVELQASSPRALPGEKARVGSFAVAVLPFGADPHTFFGSQSYAQDIAGAEFGSAATSAPESAAALWAASGPRQRSAVTIDQAFLTTKLGQLSGATPTTIGSTTVTIEERRSEVGKANARAFLKQEYESLGFTTSEQTYSTPGSGTNFIAEKAGTDPTKVFLLTAHLDNVGYAGADDDGAGTIAALAIARALKGQTLRYTLRIVAFDQEELGLYGSTAYADSLDAAGTMHQLVGVMNLEMLGYDSDNDGAYHVIDCDENTSADLSALITRVVARDGLALKRVDACTNRSDHAVFWTYGVPAVVVSQNFFGGDENPCYHRACDKVDRVNFGYMATVSTAIGRGVEDLLVSP